MVMRMMVDTVLQPKATIIIPRSQMKARVMLPRTSHLTAMASTRRGKRRRVAAKEGLIQLLTPTVVTLPLQAWPAPVLVATSRRSKLATLGSLAMEAMVEGVQLDPALCLSQLQARPGTAQ